MTGFEDLDPGLTEPFHDRLAAVFPSEMAKLLTAFAALPGQDLEKEVTDSIVKDPVLGKDLAPLIKEIIDIWYLGSFYMPVAERAHMPPANIDQYKGQRMFPLIKAPVRAFSTRPYGYWKDKPQGG